MGGGSAALANQPQLAVGRGKRAHHDVVDNCIVPTGVAYAELLHEIRRTIAVCRAIARLSSHAEALANALGAADVTTEMLLQTMSGDTALALANASTYLKMLGHIVVAWIWLDLARATLSKGETATAGDENFYEGKVLACAWFFRWELPRIALHAQLLKSLDRSCLDIRVEHL